MEVQHSLGILQIKTERKDNSFEDMFDPYESSEFT